MPPRAEKTRIDWIVLLALGVGAVACLNTSLLQTGGSHSAWNGIYGFWGFACLCAIVYVGALALWQWWLRRRTFSRFGSLLLLWLIYVCGVVAAAIQSEFFIRVVRWGVRD